MSSGFGQSTSGAILNHILGKTSYTMPSSVYVALYTVAPTATTAGTEVSGNNYSRVTVAPTAFTVTNASAASNADITFPTPSGSWSTVVAASLMSATTGGTLIAFGSLTVSKTIAQDDIIKFASGNLTISLA